MCGKFTQLASWEEVVAFSRPVAFSGAEPVETATPMRLAKILRLDGEGAREIVSMRWGFAAKSAANPSRPTHMHARGESIDERATFADAFAHARGVLVVASFNEGEELPNGKTRQWVITPNDNMPIAIAVICEEWRNGADALWTFVQVTTPANALIAPVTDRMPAILQPADFPLWLGETDAPLAEVKALLRTYDDCRAWSIAPQAQATKTSPQRDLFS
jgi:putative SOS response-associated peptidase YedK